MKEYTLSIVYLCHNSDIWTANENFLIAVNISDTTHFFRSFIILDIIASSTVLTGNHLCIIVFYIHKRKMWYCVYFIDTGVCYF